MKVKAKVEHKLEQDIIIEGLRKNGRCAYDATLANGIPATVLRGKNICRIEPNGKVSIIAKMMKKTTKVSHKTFKLK